MALQKKTAYEKKINELQGQVEEKARELQKVSERVESAHREKRDLAVQKSNTIELVASLQVTLTGLLSVIDEKKQAIKILIEPTAQYEELQKAITYLESVLEAIKKSIKDVDKAKKEIMNLGEKSDKLSQVIIGKEEIIDSLKGNIRERRKDLKESEELVIKIVGDADAKYKFVSEQMEAINDSKKVLAFYTKRLKKFYIQNGRPWPRELEEFVTVKYVPSKKLKEKLNGIKQQKNT